LPRSFEKGNINEVKIVALCVDDMWGGEKYAPLSGFAKKLKQMFALIKIPAQYGAKRHQSLSDK
jgi:hypothetical protein